VRRAARGRSPRVAKSTATPLTVNVGITGHRASLLTDNLVEALEPIVEQVFRTLRDAAATIESDPGYPDTVELRLHTPLASGADQLAARSAHAIGYQVSALLPFGADEYRNDFAAGPELDEFEGALDAAHDIVALPGARSDPVGAYVHVGIALIDKADIMVAIWDGGEGNGPGGTAHVVELALESSVPVIHIAIDRDEESVTTRLLVGGKPGEPVVQSLSGTESYCALLQDTLKGARSDATGKWLSRRTA
jgi:hypothetical protein